jgi:putative RNA 2'-phosphotransferase
MFIVLCYNIFKHMNENRVRYSKFISLVLRHKPQILSIQIDPAGWVNVEALLSAMNARNMPIDMHLLEQLVSQNDKQRFAFNADRTKIRANQGHSIAVDLGLAPRIPPEFLYHGTALKNLPSIRAQGLLRGRRQAVHLSSDIDTAEKVGRRHGEPVVLIVEAVRMDTDGFVFTLSENGVWLVDRVPPEYISTSQI